MGNKITRRCANVDERYTRPQGLYPPRDFDQKKLRRLILDSKLAPCFPGEDELNADFEECPICFLCYPSLNRSKCCSKGVCTECYLQMKSPRAARATQCPFCKSHNYNVEFRGGKTQEEKSIEAAEEQMVIEAKIRIRKQEILEEEEREQRQKETHCPDDTPETPVAEIGDNSSVVELPESCSIHADLIETSQQESVTSGLSDSSCDDMDSSRVQEESGSEGSLASITPAPQQPVLAPSSPTSQPTESATSQYQARPAPSVYTRRRADELDFDLEDIMVMEAIWQSIQEQGTCHRYTTSEPVQMASNQPDSEFGVAASQASVSQAQSPPTGSEHHHLRASGSITGGLATAIAALAERHAIKGEHVYEALHRASAGQTEVGTSSCAMLMNAPVMASLPRLMTSKLGEVLLPQTFEEQMMLAMALSITDAQSRTRLKDSHPRPLPNVS